MTQEAISSSVLTMLACPVCHGALSPGESFVACTQCGRHYPIKDGIPVLLADRATDAADAYRDK